MEVNKKQRHFVLVHGACHGAWTWYKLKPKLECAGHYVTLLDLAASGINNKKAAHDVQTFYDYSEPLLESMASLPPNEKVILVGHSMGGFNLALAMDEFPEKISVAVFLTAFMPDTVHQPSYVLEQHRQRASADFLLDSTFLYHGSTKEPSMLFGPKLLSSKLYQQCPIEDLELAKTLIRPTPPVLEDLSKAKKFSDEGYGSIKRVYVVCNEDKCITEEFQRWMIQNSEVKEVMEIKGADHMPMFSTTQELCDCLMAIAHKYTY